MVTKVNVDLSKIQKVDVEMAKNRADITEFVAPRERGGVCLHEFTVDEYHQIFKRRVMREDDPVELLDGRLCIKLDKGPPYDVPLGVPPQMLANHSPDCRPQRRFTLHEYRNLVQSGVLHPGLRSELVDGWVIDRLPSTPKHDSTLQRIDEVLRGRLARKWRVRPRCALTLNDGEVDPDLAVVRGPIERFERQHPRPCDIALLVEVADKTLEYDRGPKLREYARNYVQNCLIANLVDGQMEQYSWPSGPTEQPAYRKQSVFRRGGQIELVVQRESFGSLAVVELLGNE